MPANTYEAMFLLDSTKVAVSWDESVKHVHDILVKHQKITSNQLDAAIHRQSKERDKKLGEILVGMGVISQEDLEGISSIDHPNRLGLLVNYRNVHEAALFHFRQDIVQRVAGVAVGDISRHRSFLMTRWVGRSA